MICCGRFSSRSPSAGIYEQMPTKPSTSANQKRTAPSARPLAEMELLQLWLAQICKLVYRSSTSSHSDDGSIFNHHQLRNSAATPSTSAAKRPLDRSALLSSPQTKAHSHAGAEDESSVNVAIRTTAESEGETLCYQRPERSNSIEGHVALILLTMLRPSLM